MSTLLDWLGNAALALVAWTAVSVVVVWPIVWWMRVQATENDEALTLMTSGQSTGAPVGGERRGQLAAGGPPGR